MEGEYNSDVMMGRIRAAREKATKIAAEKSRLHGEITSLQQRLDELVAECRTKFKCEPAELGDLIAKARENAVRHLEEAEKILGIAADAASTSNGIF